MYAQAGLYILQLFFKQIEVLNLCITNQTTHFKQINLQSKSKLNMQRKEKVLRPVILKRMNFTYTQGFGYSVPLMKQKQKQANPFTNKNNYWNGLNTKVFDLNGLIQKAKFNKPNLFKTYYAELRKNSLKLYDKNDKNKLKFVLNFEQVTCQIAFEKGFIKLQVDKHYLFLLFHTQKDVLMEWFVAIDYYLGKIKPLYTFDTLPHHFWKREIITEQEFKKKSESLDILLFHSKNQNQFLQKFIAKSQYDHIGLILRSSNDEIFIFEASNGQGVTLINWELFRSNNWQSDYTKIVYRKLSCTRTMEMIQKLQTFVRTSVGQKYSLTLYKLLITESIATKEESEDGRTYFCSELVAAAYKRAGILNTQKSSTQFWPKCFSNEGQLTLSPGCSLELEREIIF